MQKETFFYSVHAMIEENQLGSSRALVPTCAYVICVVGMCLWFCDSDLGENFFT